MFLEKRKQMNDKWLNTKELAEYTSKGYHQALELMKNPKFPSILDGNRFKVKMSEVDKYLISESII